MGDGVTSYIKVHVDVLLEWADYFSLQIYDNVSYYYTIILHDKMICVLFWILDYISITEYYMNEYSFHGDGVYA